MHVATFKSTMSNHRFTLLALNKINCGLRSSLSLSLCTHFHSDFGPPPPFFYFYVLHCVNLSISTAYTMCPIVRKITTNKHHRRKKKNRAKHQGQSGREKERNRMDACYSMMPSKTYSKVIPTLFYCRLFNYRFT